MNQKSKQVFRPTVSADQMLGTVEVLQHYRSVYGLNKDATELLVKFERDLVSIGYGTKAPAYVATGVRKESAVTLDSLGATEEDKINTGSGKYSNPAQLSDDMEAELERLNTQMLKEEAAKGNANVTLTDRRKEIRVEDNTPTDNDNVFAAFSKQHSIDIGDL